MRPLILLVLLGLPVSEIVGFVEIGGRIGVLATLAWLFLAAVAGIVVIRLQGLATAMAVRAALARDELPARALFDGACVVLAGLLLLFPGFVSDGLAVLLLLPPLRALLFRLVARRLRGHVTMGLRRGSGGAAPRRGGMVIEGELEEVEPPPPQRPRNPPRLPPDGRRDDPD